MKDISKLTGAELGALIKLTLKELEVYRLAHKRWVEQDRKAKSSLRKLNSALKKKEKQVLLEELKEEKEIEAEYQEHLNRTIKKVKDLKDNT
jgi:hypothetical protein